MDFLSKSLAAWGGNRGLRGGVKGVAAVAAGRWLYKQWQSNKAQKSNTTTTI